MVSRAIVSLLILASCADAGQLVVTNNVTALDVNAHPIVMQPGVPYRYSVYATDGVSPINLTSAPAPAVLWYITDPRDRVTVAVYTGEVVNAVAGGVRYHVNPSTNIEYGVSYLATAIVSRVGGLATPIAMDLVSIAEPYCSTCRLSGASSSGDSGGSFSSFTGPGTTGGVSSTTGDTNKFLSGDGLWRVIRTPVVVWSNGTSLAVCDALQFTTGFGVRVVTDGTDTIAQIYPTFLSGQGGSIPGSTQIYEKSYTGSTQTQVVAANETQYLAQIWGAGAGASGSDGGYTEVTFPVTPFETLYLVVGQGTSRTNTTPGVRPFGGAGFLLTTNVGGVLNIPGASGSFIFRLVNGTQAVVACAGGAGYGSDGGGETAQTLGGGSTAGKTNGGVATVKTTNTDGSYLLGGNAATNGGSGGGSGWYGGFGSHTNNTTSGGGSGTIQFGLGITVRSTFSFSDDYPGQPLNYSAPVGTGSANGGGHGYIKMRSWVAP